MTDHLTPEDRALCEALEHGRVTLKSGDYDGGDIMRAWCNMVAAATRIRELSAKLAAAEADAGRLAEAGASCADDLEAEVNNRWGYDERLERQLRRDLTPVVEFRQALAAHEARKIDGQEPT